MNRAQIEPAAPWTYVVSSRTEDFIRLFASDKPTYFCPGLHIEGKLYPFMAENGV